MSDFEDDSLAAGWREMVQRVRARTPARLLVGRAGAGYRTETQIDLREAHAAARDAIGAEMDLRAVFEEGFLEQWKLFEVVTQAGDKRGFLLRPQLGRHFADSSRAAILNRCSKGNDVQVAVGDGLSVPAVAAQVPELLPRIVGRATERGWTVGGVFAVRHCRVGILNEIGELLSPTVAVLLIGERPGLATAASLSAYMAYRPEATHTDANRNLVSNIHARGLSARDAADQIISLAELMMRARSSGCNLKLGQPMSGHQNIFRP